MLPPLLGCLKYIHSEPDLNSDQGSNAGPETGTLSLTRGQVLNSGRACWNQYRKASTDMFVLIGNCVSRFLHFTAAKECKFARAISLHTMFQAESR